MALKLPRKLARKSNLKLIPKKVLPDYLPKLSGIIQVPIELLNDFILNSPKALRDFASIPTDAITPFYGDLTSYFDKFLLNAEINPFNSFTQKFTNSFICGQDDDRARYLHIDLGVSKDAAGFSMCHVDGYKTVERVSEISKSGLTQYSLPNIVFDFSGRIVARKGEEINISMFRDLILALRDDRGFNINLVTFDRFQSIDSIQLLREMGFTSGALSIDRTANVLKINYSAKNFIEKVNTDKQYATAHEMLRTAIFDDRVTIPRVNPRVEALSEEERDWSEEFEFNSQEFDVIKNVVYKSTHGTDDWIQSIAGSLCNATVNEMDVYNAETEASTSELEDDNYDPYDIKDPYENYNVGIY